MADIIYRIAAGWLTVTQINSLPTLIQFPPQYPVNTNTNSSSKLAQWHYPDKSSDFKLAETRREALSGELQSFGFASAHWDWPFMTWAKMLYLYTNVYASSYDSAPVTIQMPNPYFGNEVTMLTYYGWGKFPFPNETMKNITGPGQGKMTVRFNFNTLRESIA